MIWGKGADLDGNAGPLEVMITMTQCGPQQARHRRNQGRRNDPPPSLADDARHEPKVCRLTGGGRNSNFRFRARRNRFQASGALSMFLKLFVFCPDAENQPHTPRRGFVRQGLPISSKIAASGHKTPSALSLYAHRSAARRSRLPSQCEGLI